MIDTTTSEGPGPCPLCGGRLLALHHADIWHCDPCGLFYAGWFLGDPVAIDELRQRRARTRGAR